MFSKTSIQTVSKFCASLYEGSFKLTRPIVFSTERGFNNLFNSKNRDISFKNMLQNSIKEGITSFKQVLKLFNPAAVEDPFSMSKKLEAIFSKTIYRYILRSPI